MAANFVRMPNNDIAELQSQINGLVAVGATSIDLGMKWGVTLLDPDTRSILSEMITSGEVPGEFAGRPFEYDDPEVLKVIVLMTDGEHFTEQRLNDDYLTAFADDELTEIYSSNGDGKLSIRHPTGRPSTAGSDEYWVPHLWNDSARTYGKWQATAYDSGSGTTRLDWNEVWQVARLQWVAWNLYANALGTSTPTKNALYTEWMDKFRSQTDTTVMDDRLQDVCAAAKGKGVLVFGIAFEAPANGQAQIRKCASSSAHYFDASGVEINTAFRAIASQISHLRLTQ